MPCMTTTVGDPGKIYAEGAGKPSPLPLTGARGDDPRQMWCDHACCVPASPRGEMTQRRHKALRATTRQRIASNELSREGYLPDMHVI